VKPYFDNERFLHALAESIRPYLAEEYDHVLFSYHGIPERHVKKSDPTGSHCLQSPDCCTTDSVAHKTCYRHQCRFTTTDIAARLGLEAGTFTTSFQSRLGRDPWLQPYTAELLPKLPGMGIKKLVVICPAFSADCLETLEEMDVEGKNLFIEAGGESFVRVPCLNTHPLWVEAVQSWLDDIAAGKREMILE
jgi:ferrochelatase